MTRRTIFLFIRALIIGIILNFTIQQVSETVPASQTATSFNQINFATGQAPDLLPPPF